MSKKRGSIWSAVARLLLAAALLLVSGPGTASRAAIQAAPVAGDDTGTVAEGGTLNQAAPGVLSNDSDPESELLTVDTTPVTAPVQGNVTLNADGSYSYTHDGSETSSDSFEYEVCDPGLLCDTATVTLTVTAVNDPPLAGDDTGTVAEGGTLNQSAPGVLINDSDPEGAPLAVNATPVTAPAHGSVTLNANGSYSYTHDGSETAIDSFEYEACDGGDPDLCDTATVTLTVTDVNDPPLAGDDTGTVAEGGTLNQPAPGVLSNDSDPEGAPLAVSTTPVTAPAHGNVTLNADGSYSYTHDGSETSSDSFVYEVCDGGTPNRCDTATVTLTVTAVNDPPLAGDDTGTVAEGGTLNEPAPGVLSNDSDPEGAPLVVTTTPVTAPAHGSVTLNANGSYSYTHDGSETASDSFVYEVCDPGPLCDTATVNLTITAVNDPPVAGDDTGTVAEGGTLNQPAPGVLSNDSDPEGAPLVVTTTPVTAPAHGSVTLNANGSYSYTHDGSETASDSFVYEVCDPGPLCDTATVSLTVTPVNDPPVVSISAPANGTTFDEGESINFIGSASDAEDGNVTASLQWVSDVDGVIGSGGTFIRSDLSLGPHTITATATDSGALSGSDAITIIVNAAPVVSISAPANGATFRQGSSISFSGSGSDMEDGDVSASLQWVSNVDGLIGTGGAFSSASLSLGLHTITATATDSAGSTGSNAIAITVRGGIDVLPTALTISEPNESKTFILKLTGAPAATVSVGLTAIGGECMVSPPIVELHSGNWSDGAVATVTAVDDFIVDGPKTCTVVTGSSSSSDLDFDNVNPVNVTVTVNDNDVAGFAAVPPGLGISEPHGSDTFRLKLTSQPAAPVTVGLSAVGGQCNVSPASVNLNADNWSTGVLATVTAVNDDIADGPKDCPVRIGPASSADTLYNGLSGEDVTVIVYDDDEVGIIALPGTLDIGEPSGSDTFVVTLNSEPTAQVSVILSAAGGQCNVSPASVKLDADNWESGVPALVTAVDDAIADGTQNCPVQIGPASSADTGYQGLSGDSVLVRVFDNDVAGIHALPDGLEIGEPNGSEPFIVTLNSQPTALVTVGLTAVGGQCTVSPASVNLSASNWSTGQAAVVTAVDDAIADGPQTCVVRTGPASSADPVYQLRRGNDVVVLVQDNDVAGIYALPSILEIGEPAGFAGLTVRLNSEPTDLVSVALSAVGGQCTVSPASVNLHSGNWSSGAPAVVTAVDDFIVDGPQNCPVQIGPASSADKGYQGLSGSGVTVTVNDNDVAGIEVDDTSLSVSEPNGTDTFILTLTSEPIATVSVGLSVVGTECTVSSASVDLDDGNWRDGVAVIVTAVDDYIDDSTQTCLVVTEPAVSADPNYLDKDPPNVSVRVYDNDTAGISIGPTGLTISEPDGSAMFTVTLKSQPVNPVFVDLTALGGECTVSPASLEIDASNWSEGAAAKVTAVNDAIDDDLQTCTIVTARTRSDDPKYNDLHVTDVGVTVDDDDEAGIDLVPLAMELSEPDGSAILTVTLASQPVALVSIGLSALGGECTVSPASVDLGAANWSSGVTATVTAVNDDLEDGTQDCLVQTAAASSSDPKYLGRSVPDVAVTVRDDDIVYRIYLPTLANRWPPVPGVPTLYPIDNADGNGTYTVDWSEVPQAGSSYVLEEASDSAFSDATVAYSGASTSLVVSQRGAGRTFYRVKARNSWGDSGWSAVQSVDVLWEAEPNNQASQANGPIALGLTYYGTFPSEADGQDYFKFKLSSPNRVELSLTNMASDQNYDLVLRDAALSVKGFSGNLGNSGETILTGVLPVGTYYIQVYRNPDSSGGSGQAYHLWVGYK